MKKFAPLLVLVAILGLMIVLLNRPKTDAPPNQTTQTPLNERSLTIVAPWEITSADPAKSGSLFGQLGIAETLVDADDQGNLVSGLADSWSANANFDEWTFVLKQGVFFHDHSPLNADAVINSLNIVLTKPTALTQANIKSIQKIDDKTIKFILEKPLNTFAAYLAHYSTLILAPASYDDKSEPISVIGTGAYQVTKLEPPQKIQQHAFGDYWGKKATIQNITYLANSRSETRTLLAQTPDHLVYNLDGVSMKHLSEDPNTTTQSKSIARTIQYKVNASHPFLGNQAVRQILSNAIDRKGIAQTINQQDIGAAWELLPPIFKDWQIGAPAQTPDYNALKTQLMALGFDYDKTGNLTQNGKPVQLTLKTFSDRPELPVIATALQSQFKELGIALEVAVGNSSDIPAAHQNGTLEMALYARNYGLVPDPSGILAEDFKPQGNDWGAMNYQNSALTQAFDELGRTSDEQAKQKLKTTIATILYEDRPITPILYYQQNVAYNKNLKGVKLDPFERKFYLNELSF